ncbi:DegT/DnrJ/EryC1/StrS family aminotransferase, partial [Pectobacterium actinidiae]
SYFPIFLSDSFPKKRDEIYEHLKTKNIFSRRYFYPLISSFPMYRGLDSAEERLLPSAVNISDNVLCLPIYPDLSEEDIFKIVEFILE